MMIARDDQAGVDSELTADAPGSAMKLTLCKVDDTTTYYTLEGSADQARAHMRAFGTKEPDFFFGLLQQIVNAGSKGKYPDEPGVKFMLAFIRSRQPRDEFEATFLSQMAATQLAIMRFANRLAHAETLQAQDSAERTLNKLMRTFNMQVEAFQHCRFVNEKMAFVERSSANESQAITENITLSGRESGEENYQHLIVTAERKFWRCVENGEPPTLFGVEPPKPRIAAVRIVDMSTSNAWAEFAGTFARTHPAFLEHERAKSELMRLLPEDAQQAIGHGVRAKRSKSGAITFELLKAEDGHAAV